MNYVMRGVGMAIGLALWPITLPVAAVVAIGAMVQAGSRDDAEPAQTQWQPDAVEPAPMLGGLRAEALAVVTESNREHLERCNRV